MLTVNIHEIKSKLSYYLNLVQKGKKIIIAKRNIPIAEIAPIEKEMAKRIIGQADKKFTVSANFFKPLPQNIIEDFNNPK